MSSLSKVSLKNQTAVITGATKNLGESTAHELAALGANLVLHYHSDSEKSKSEALIKGLESKYSTKAYSFQGDLSKPDVADELFDFAIEKFGSFQVAINNAGMVLKKPILDTKESEFDKVFEVNTKAAYFFIKSAGSKISEDGAIITLVTSLLAAYTPFYSVYQGAKASVEYFSKSASKELQSKAISVNCVAPGPMDTPFLYGQEEDQDIEFYKSCGQHNRLTKKEDIVPIIRFLATEGHWITGQTIYASGGFTAH